MAKKKFIYIPTVLTLAFYLLGCGSTGSEGQSETDTATEEATNASTPATSLSDAASQNTQDSALETKEGTVENAYTDEAGHLIYLSADVQPAYPGGQEEMIKYLQENLKYPDAAKSKKAEGTVMVEFVVDADGTIKHVQAAKTLEDESLNEEAIRVVSQMPSWEPGMQNGEQVRVKYALPITFKYQ